MIVIKHLDDPDLQAALQTQLRDLWTHTTTALEGNTLTLGDTSFVLKEGLTVAGKPLKDHQEVVGHARAIDLPPIIIPREQRKEYIDGLSAGHFAVGQIKAGEELLPESDQLEPFTELCRQAWQASISLVEEAQKRQEVRDFA